jgi:hypothetical protein
MENKTTHDYKCQNCGKPATINLQQNYQLFDIADNGDTSERKAWEGDTNEFYCAECAEKEMID